MPDTVVIITDNEKIKESNTVQTIHCCFVFDFFLMQEFKFNLSY